MKDHVDFTEAAIRSRVRVRVVWILVCAVLVLGIFGGGMFVLGTIQYGRVRDLRQQAIVKKVVTVQVVAQKAHDSAQRDHALIFAICRAFNRRDQAQAYFDAQISIVAKTYPTLHSQAYYAHMLPLLEQRRVVMGKLASSDCQHLMSKALKDASLPANRRPSPVPLIPGTHF